MASRRIQILERYKRGIELLSFILGIGVAVYFGDSHKFLALVGFLLALIPFMVIERLQTAATRVEFRQGQLELARRLDRIDNHLKASRPDELTVAVFDKLLLNLPLYLADHLGYLAEEGIRIKHYVSMYNDKDVAREVSNFAADVGICDPCMCARKEFRKGDGTLYILAPLLTRNGAIPVTNRVLSVRTRLITGGDLTIGTYPPPSTTYVMAVSLMEKLQAYGRAKRTKNLNVTLEPIEGDKIKEDKIDELLNHYDIVMLWEPFLSVAKRSRQNDVFVLNDDPVKETDLDVMYSSLVISHRVLAERPTLGLRLFRALSRSVQRLHLAAHQPKHMIDIIRVAHMYMSALPNENELGRILRKMIEYQLVPFFDNAQSLDQYIVEWRRQLFRALLTRKTASAKAQKEFKDSVLAIVNEDQCDQLFCPRDVLAGPLSPIATHAQAE